MNFFSRNFFNLIINFFKTTAQKIKQAALSRWKDHWEDPFTVATIGVNNILVSRHLSSRPINNQSRPLVMKRMMMIFPT